MEQDRRKVDLEQCQHRSILLPGLRAARWSLALSQHQLAERAGVSSNTVRLLENGLKGSYPSTLKRLAMALDVPPAELTRGHRPE